MSDRPSGSEYTSGGTERTAGRRRFLRSLGLAVGAGSLAGCLFGGNRSQEQSPGSPGGTTASPSDGSGPDGTPSTPNNGTVTGSGSPNGDPTTTTDRVTAPDLAEGEEVSGLVADIAAGDILEFPPGTFSWSKGVLVTADDWEIHCDPNTVFEVPAGLGDGEEVNLLSTQYRNRSADGVVLTNFTFDSPGRAAPGINFGVRTEGRISGLEYRMNGPRSPRQHDNGISANVEHPDGSMAIENYRQFNNGDLGAYAGGESRVGLWVGPRNEGTIQVTNPVLQGFPNNACYVSRQPGTVRIDGGLFINNNVSAVRVSGGVELRNSTIYIDIDQYEEGSGSLAGSEHNTRGVWADSLGEGTPGGIVENVSLVLQNYRRSTGLATVLENPKMTLRDCQFLLNEDIEAIQAQDGEIEVRNCTFSSTETRATAGVGNIVGDDNYVDGQVVPGDVPVVTGQSREFSWLQTHPETPSRERFLDEFSDSIRSAPR